MCSRVLLALLATLLVPSCKDSSDAEVLSSQPPPVSEPAATQDVFVVGPLLVLRQVPAAEGPSVGRFRFGRLCTALAPAQGEWRRVRCGDKQGYALASLLSPEVPSLEKFQAQAKDPQRPLAEREEAALRAVALLPEDAALSEELVDLFFAHHLERAAHVETHLDSPELPQACLPQEDLSHCIASSAGLAHHVERRAETKDAAFVIALHDESQFFVYRGRFHVDANGHPIEQVLERARLTPAPELRRVLFPEKDTRAVIAADLEDKDGALPPLGQLVLDTPAQAFLRTLPPTWWRLKPSAEAEARERGWLVGCSHRAYTLRLSADVHGRWSTLLEAPDLALPERRWVAAVSQTERGARLTLVRYAEDPKPRFLELPNEARHPAKLDEALYGSRPLEWEDAWSDPGPCTSDEGSGPSFSGEFSPGKAMAALYGRFDAKRGTSSWIPTAAERERLHAFERFNAANDGVLQARAWTWEPYREGARERMLFLTQTRPLFADHVSSALIGGGVFVKTPKGWRLARALRSMLELGTYGEAPNQDISVHAVGERGFVAVLPTQDSNLGEVDGGLVLLSDVGGDEVFWQVGLSPDTLGNNTKVCPPSAPECYAYGSTWAFVPREGQALPDFVVTTSGTHMTQGEGSVRERFRRVNTYSVGKDGRYAEASSSMQRE